MDFAELLFPPDNIREAGSDIISLIANWFICREYFMPIANYPRMSSTTAVVGYILGGVDRIMASEAQNKIQERKTFCVGHSLGAQVCGFMGKSLRSEYNEPELDGIIGIDPAGPTFEHNSKDNKLWQGDAKVSICEIILFVIKTMMMQLYTDSQL